MRWSLLAVPTGIDRWLCSTTKTFHTTAAFRLAGIKDHPTGFWISQEPPKDGQGPLICSQESAVVAGKGDHIRVDAVEIMGNARSHDFKFAAKISADARPP